MTLDPRQSLKSEPKRITLLDTETETNEAAFAREYSFFKIAPVDVTGIGVDAVIELLVGGRPVIVNNDIAIAMTYTGAAFIWVVTLLGGADHISLRFSEPATDDVVFQITGYEEAVS